MMNTKEMEIIIEKQICIDSLVFKACVIVITKNYGKFLKIVITLTTETIDAYCEN